MEREKKIIDASVVVKWFAYEEDSEKADILKNKHVSNEVLLVAPELIFIEVINALKYKKFNFDSLNKINKVLWDFQIKIEKLNENILEKAIKISLENNLSLYDSVYIALSQIYGAELISADEILSKIPNVRLLKDIK